MYAIVKTGGKQYRVEKGLQLDVELVGAGKKTLTLEPLLVVDGKKVITKPADLKKLKVKAKVLEEVKGAKIQGFTYKSASNQRRRYGHRQTYSRIEVTEITSASSTGTAAKPKTAAAKPKTAAARTKPVAKPKAAPKKAPTKPKAPAKATAKATKALAKGKGK